jgi:hypothetical protein
MATDEKPEIGATADASGIKTNYLEVGEGDRSSSFTGRGRGDVLCHLAAGNPGTRGESPGSGARYGRLRLFGAATSHRIRATDLGRAGYRPDGYA